MRIRIATKDDWGWELPPGCSELDPQAPWNQKELPEECIICGEPNLDETGEPFYDGTYCSSRCEMIAAEDKTAWLVSRSEED